MWRNMVKTNEIWRFEKNDKKKVIFKLRNFAHEVKTLNRASMIQYEKNTLNFTDLTQMEALAAKGDFGKLVITKQD